MKQQQQKQKLVVFQKFNIINLILVQLKTPNQQ